MLPREDTGGSAQGEPIEGNAAVSGDSHPSSRASQLDGTETLSEQSTIDHSSSVASGLDRKLLAGTTAEPILRVDSTTMQEIAHHSVKKSGNDWAADLITKVIGESAPSKPASVAPSKQSSSVQECHVSLPMAEARAHGPSRRSRRPARESSSCWRGVVGARTGLHGCRGRVCGCRSHTGSCTPARLWVTFAALRPANLKGGPQA